MRIIIGQPLGYSHIGSKENQEDSVYPLFEQATPEQRVFVLCDGVGGSEHGEVASRTVADAMGEYLGQQSGVLTAETIDQAVNHAYDVMDAVDNSTDTHRMATTLTCVCLHEGGILAAHMGDSRIYHIRPGKGILYRSDDHSLVNALLKAGELTPEEALTFPRRNVITKAMQPHADYRFTAEVHNLEDICAGDFIFLCSDGVLERLSEEQLVEILSGTKPHSEMVAELEAIGVEQTRDNFTAYLIPIVGVEEEIPEIPVVAAEEPVAEVEAPVVPPVPQIPATPPVPVRRRSWLGRFWWVIVLAAVGITLTANVVKVLRDGADENTIIRFSINEDEECEACCDSCQCAYGHCHCTDPERGTYCGCGCYKEK